MALHNETGKEGEELATQWLESQGYTIIERNWRFSRFEIDIVATIGECIHFVEVKTRTSRHFGFPEDQVNKKKLRQLLAAGSEYIFQNSTWNKVRYDILSVNIIGDLSEFLLIEDVYIW